MRIFAYACAMLLCVQQCLALTTKDLARAAVITWSHDCDAAKELLMYHFGEPDDTKEAMIDLFLSWVSWLGDEHIDLDAWMNDPRNYTPFTDAMLLIRTNRVTKMIVRENLKNYFPKSRCNDYFCNVFVDWVEICFLYVNRKTSHHSDGGRIILCSGGPYELSEEGKQGVRDEIQEMREEAARLREDGFDRIVRSGVEAAGAGVSIATGRPELGFITGYIAEKEFLKGCEEYGEGVKLEEKVQELEDTFENLYPEEKVDNENKDNKGQEEEPDGKSWWWWK